MDTARLETVRSIGQRTPEWIPLLVRLVLVALVAKPAASKFVTYDSSVAFFDAYGVPAPAATVIVAGLVEVAAVLSLLSGIGVRIAALALLPVMIVAILYVGPDWKNLAVVLGSVTILLVATGPNSPRQIAARIVG
ncbi:DoxX family protein [Natrinema salaciae]|uniref:DoxX protein n=1 Tax=Natrinema salaciae TaxID=1186196 RepID=A0A1H9M4T2_9EURY|nr:DoxX family protein [Natrinema salaciae]SER18143.1 DoxX protein [Natrinema salaciae]